MLGCVSAWGVLALGGRGAWAWEGQVSMPCGQQCRGWGGTRRAGSPWLPPHQDAPHRHRDTALSPVTSATPQPSLEAPFRGISQSFLTFKRLPMNQEAGKPCCLYIETPAAPDSPPAVAEAGSVGTRRSRSHAPVMGCRRRERSRPPTAGGATGAGSAQHNASALC